MFPATNNAPGAQTGPELLEISTDAIGWQSLAGETRLRLLPNPWPADGLPKPTSSLLSIASKQELVAAAGPDILVLADLKAVRAGFTADAPTDNKIKQFTPQLTIQVPSLSQLAFSSDESSLTLCAAQGGGLAVYDVQALKQGNKEAAFQISTNGIPVRALVPNPAPEFAYLLAIVLDQGQLMIANVKEHNFESGSRGMIMKEAVSCVSWSNKGKQLTAGLGNGTAVQMTPAGETKAEIPKFPALEGDMHVSGVSWLDNDHWLIIYTPSKVGEDGALDSAYVYVSREKGSKSFGFQKLQDPCVPFGMNRSPAHHFITRFREYPPSLADAIILSSTCNGELGLITCSQVPLANSPFAAGTANQYTTTSVENDARKAQLPVDESMTDTSSIGMALDLSSRDPVRNPIPTEEMELSATPLPGVAVLNNEGVLSYWWFVYSESVRQGKVYPGLVVAGGPQVQSQPTSQQQPQSGFGVLGKPQSAFETSNVGSNTSPSPFGKPAAPAFGTSLVPTFGTSTAPATTSAFGSSVIGMNKSPWTVGSSSEPKTAGAAFGQSAFGKSSQISAAAGFGSVSDIGQKASPWSAGATSAPGENKPSPFKGFAGSSGFAALGQQSADKSASPFSTMSGTSSGFAALGQTSKSPLGTQAPSSTPALGTQPSPFRGLAGSSGFAALGQQSADKSTSPFSTMSGASSGFAALGQTSNSPISTLAPSSTPALGTQPSFGSTMTIGSSLNSSGAPSTFGEPKSAWVTPVLSNNNSNITARVPDTDMDDDMDSDKDNTTPPKVRDNNSSLASKPSSGGSKVQSTFKPETESIAPANSAQAEPSLFGVDFGSVLEVTQQPALETSQPAESAPIKAFDGKAIKVEPEDEPPLPPDPSTYKVEPVPESAPFPPSPKAQPVEPKSDALPPSPNISDPAANEEPPLPPSPTTATKSPEISHSPTGSEPVAGSEPVDLGASSGSQFSGLSDLPEEPSPPESHQKKSDKPRFQTSWQFGAPQSPEAPESKNGLPISPLHNFSTTPSTIGKPQAPDTPFDGVKPPVIFAPPSRLREGSRSPSPIRNQQRFGGQRSLSSPSPRAKEQYGTTPTGPIPTRSTMMGGPVPVKPSLFGDSARMNAVVESRDLSTTAEEVFEEDDSERHIAAELAALIKPTKNLAPFLAHQDYVGSLGGTGIPAQIEKVYRDVNSMIDTLGLNARSLKAWIAGHSDYRDGGVSRESLYDDNDNEWSLTETEDLAVIQKDISGDLDTYRIDDAEETVAALFEMRQDAVRLRHTHYGLQSIIEMSQNPETDDEEAAKKLSSSLNSRASISPRKSKLQNPHQHRLVIELRKKYTNLQTLLAEAEDSLSILRAKVASASSAASSSGQLPTVEAVLSTISKLTAMIESKRGDVDVLEARMKRLKFRAANDAKDLDEVLGAMTIRGESRETTPLRTPPSRRRGGAVNGVERYELKYDDSSDGEARDGHAAVTPKTPLGRSVSSNGRHNARALVGELSKELVQARASRLLRKRAVFVSLKKQVGERGTRITSLE